MIEAAVAYYEATGKKKFLTIVQSNFTAQQAKPGIGI